jgi:hypothetical protein
MKLIDSMTRCRSVLLALGLAAVACARVATGELQPVQSESVSTGEPIAAAPAHATSAVPTIPTEPAPPASTPATQNPLCCCTFDSADPADFGVVSTWDSLASTCVTGDSDQRPGQCIDWKWCGYRPGDEPRSLAERPDLVPAQPLDPSTCCCNIFDGTGEVHVVLNANACKARPDLATVDGCIDEGFCSPPGRSGLHGTKRRTTRS